MKICPAGAQHTSTGGKKKSIKCIQTINVSNKASLAMVPRGISGSSRVTLRKGKFRVFQKRKIAISSERYDGDTQTVPQQTWWENTSA